MTIKVFIIVAVVLIVVAVAIALLGMRYLTAKKKLTPHQQFVKYNQRYNFYDSFVLTRNFFHKIAMQINLLGVYNFMESRITAVQFFERAYLIALAVFLIGFIGLGDIISGFVLLMFAVIMTSTSISKRIDDVNFKTLKAMSSLLLSMRECYTRVRNVPDSINDAKCDPILQRHISEIYLICTAIDGDERLNRFYETCPNRILRTLATMCYIRADVGEDGLGYSPFKQGLGLIKDEVDQEVRRLTNQRLMFKSLDVLPFVPLFMYPPIKYFYTSMISATASVFESGTGYIIKLSVLLSSFVCYYILSTINNSSVATTDDRIDFITEMLESAKVRRFARTLVTKDNKKRFNLEARLKSCLSLKTIEYYYLEKYVMGAVFCGISIIFTIIIILMARGSIYNSLASSTMSIELKYSAEQERRTREYDAQVLDMEQLPSEEEMQDAFKDIFMRATPLEIDTQVERLTNKYNNYKGMHYYWWMVFIFIGCSILGFYVPDMLMNLRAKLVKSEAELDVMQMQTVIAILMDTTLDTLSVIYWLAKASEIHKGILLDCYHSYVRDPYFALRRMRDQSTIPEFAAICDKLITTIHQVTLLEAFEDLVSERANSMKIREMLQEDALKTKRNIASPIAMAPMIVWMGMVFILPIIIVAIKSAANMMGNLEMN